MTDGTGAVHVLLACGASRAALPRHLRCPSTGHARRVTRMRSQHGGRLDAAHQLAQRTAQVAQATAEAEMVRYAGGGALLNAPRSTPTTYVAWLCAKKTPLCRQCARMALRPTPHAHKLNTIIHARLAACQEASVLG
jgi:hypothetical protein